VRPKHEKEPTSWNASNRSLWPSSLIVSLFKSTIVVVLSYELKLHTLDMRMSHLDVLFLIQVYFLYKSCSSVLENAGRPVPAQYQKLCFAYWLLIMYNVYQILITCRRSDIFITKSVFVNRINNVIIIIICICAYYPFSPNNSKMCAIALLIVSISVKYNFAFYILFITGAQVE
jgi:hypothetical protein